MALAVLLRMSPRLIAINVGSSSLRLTLFDGATRRELRLDPQASGQSLAQLEETPDIVVHRIVHGGPLLRATTQIDGESLRQLEAAIPLAALHLPRALAFIEAARARWPNARSLAVFDTALYTSLPPVATTYALPSRLRALGIRRYGFHGLAHQSMLRALDGAARAITFQLGSGASVTASRDGRPIDTSMGFSPLGGLVMGTRPGDLDPGVLTFLLRQGIDIDTLDQLLERESGLYGLAGDADMRALLARHDAEARLAVDIYVARARHYLGAYLGVLGGCDALAFGGGVGEHAPAVRAAILGGFEWAGLLLDAAANAGVESAEGAPARISARASRIAAWVVPVDEAAVMRDEALHFVQPEESR